MCQELCEESVPSAPQKGAAGAGAQELQHLPAGNALPVLSSSESVPGTLRPKPSAKSWRAQMYPAAPVKRALTDDETNILRRRKEIMYITVVDVVLTPILVILGAPSILLTFFGALLLSCGPVCGFLGAKFLWRPWVTSYLFFCVVKLGYEATMLFWIQTPFRALTAVLQLLFACRTLRFWFGLLAMTPERSWQLLDDVVEVPATQETV